MKIYATSDTHFGHEKLVEYGRPSGFGLQILRNLEQLEGDLLIHCGDFCIGKDDLHTQNFMRSARGFKKKVLVRGNHDSKSDAWYLDRGWDFVCEGFANTYFGKRLVFTHIPNRKTDATGDFNIHGHMHGNTHRLKGDLAEYYDPSYHLDLAPDIHNFAPVNLEYLIAKK